MSKEHVYFRLESSWAKKRESILELIKNQIKVDHKTQLKDLPRVFISQGPAPPLPPSSFIFPPPSSVTPLFRTHGLHCHAFGPPCTLGASAAAATAAYITSVVCDDPVCR